MICLVQITPTRFPYFLSRSFISLVLSPFSSSHSFYLVTEKRERERMYKNIEREKWKKNEKNTRLKHERLWNTTQALWRVNIDSNLWWGRLIFTKTYVHPAATYRSPGPPVLRPIALTQQTDAFWNGRQFQKSGFNQNQKARWPEKAPTLTQ